MTEREQIIAFEADLNRLIDRYVAEFNLTQASAVGVLQMKVVQLSIPQDDDADESPESDETS